MSRDQRLRRQRTVHLRHIPPLEGAARSYLGSARALLHQVAGNTVRGFGAPPKPWMRWLEVLWLAPALWFGLSSLVTGGVCLGGVLLHLALGAPTDSDVAFAAAFVALMGSLGGLLGLWRLAQLRRPGRPLRTAARRAREEHIMAELLFQLLVRHDVTSGALDSDMIGLYASDRGWDVALPTREGAGHDQRHWLSLRCDAEGRWTLYAFVVGDSETNPWQGMSWGDGPTPEAAFDPNHQIWRLNLCLEDDDGLLTRYADRAPALKGEAEALLARWADHVARGLQPVLKRPGERVERARASRWGRPDAALGAAEPPGPTTAATAAPAAHASYDPEASAEVWKRARLARWGTRFGQLVTVAPVVVMACGALSDGEPWGALGAGVVAACMGGFYGQLSGVMDRATLPPSKVRAPRASDASGLAWDGAVLALGAGRVALDAPFACALSRRMGGSDAQTPMLVVDLVAQRAGGELKEARVRFQVEVEASDAWARLDRLEVHAPTVSGDAFDAWVWPLIQARLLAHGADVPGLGSSRALEAVVGVAVGAGARRGASQQEGGA